MIRTIVFAGVLATVYSPGLLASDAETVAAMRGCAGEKDDARRLACYDAKINAAATNASAPSAPAAATVGAAAAAAPSAEQNFGYRGSVAREQIDREEAAKPKLEQLTAQVTAVTMKPHGEFVVTLDNEQVWAQKRPDSKVRPQVGDSVTIKPGSLGSFHLVTSGGRSTQVSRVQ